VTAEVVAMQDPQIARWAAPASHSYLEQMREPDGVHWVKSSQCGDSYACVEVATLPDGMVGVRAGASPAGPVLRFTPAEWQAFTAGVRAGEFDR
jgi:Domain of unknown function (DUF397)